MKESIFRGLILSLILALVWCYSTAQKIVKLEAEIGAEVFHGNIENNHEGYTGSGFVNLDNEIGSSIQWTFYFPSGVDCNLTIFYANGTQAVRHMNVWVNEQPDNNPLQFSGNGDWKSWRSLALPISLIQGENTIKLVSTGSEGGPNTDRIELSGSSLPQSFSPIAQNDIFSGNINQELQCQPLVNDYDLDGDTIQIISIQDPSHGSLITLDQNSFIYTPNQNFNGIDSIHYTISDGKFTDSAPTLLSNLQIKGIDI